MKPVKVDPPVETEINEAIDYLNEARPGKGDELARLTEQAFDFIARFPQTGGRFRNTRFRNHVLKKFRYLICFEELDDCIRVVAFAHPRRRPGYWLKRAELKPPESST